MPYLLTIVTMLVFVNTSGTCVTMFPTSVALDSVMRKLVGALTAGFSCCVSQLAASAALALSEAIASVKLGIHNHSRWVLRSLSPHTSWSRKAVSK